MADALRRRLSLAFFAADEPAVLLLRAVAIERAMVEEERERFEEKGGKRRELLLPLWEGNTRALGKGMKLSFFFFFSKRVFCRLSSTSSTSTRAPIFPHFSQRDNDPILFLALARSLPRENPFLSVFLYPLIA